MSSTPVIKCESVYKIFGTNAKKMLQSANGNVDAKSFQDAGCIVGVNNLLAPATPTSTVIVSADVATIGIDLPDT